MLAFGAREAHEPHFTVSNNSGDIIGRMKEFVAQLNTFFKGYQTFVESGETPETAYLAMRRLFVLSNGGFNDAMHSLIKFQYPPKRLATPKSLLPNFGAAELNQALKNIQTRGYHVFSERLPDNVVQELYEVSLGAPSIHQTIEGVKKDLGAPFDPTNIVATNYRIPEAFAANVPAVQRIMADPAILQVAQDYLACEMIYVNAQMWWTTPKDCAVPSAALAQQFHFDMDRLKFIKFFVYLTDVDDECGPHTYIRGTCHRKPKAALRDGRFTDEELVAACGKENFVEILGKRGTMMAVETRGFHKAKMPTQGNRLILQFELANSTFGQSWGHAEVAIKVPELQAVYESSPRLLSNYKVVEKTRHGEVAVPALSSY